MHIGQDVRVSKIYKLNEDYENIFINNTANYKAHYDLVPLSSRTINKIHYDDIFVIEPGCYYYIELNSDYISLFSEDDFRNVFKESGMIIQLDKDLNRLYLFNANKNLIYIQKGYVLMKKNFVQTKGV